MQASQSPLLLPASLTSNPRVYYQGTLEPPEVRRVAER